MRKLDKGILGSPKLDYGDKVGFTYKMYGDDMEYFQVGEIYIIDRNGTFEQNEEPSYDIFCEKSKLNGEPILFKHIKESECYVDLDEGVEL